MTLLLSHAAISDGFLNPGQESGYFVLGEDNFLILHICIFFMNASSKACQAFEFVYLADPLGK